MWIHVYIYIYIYIERKRERERDKEMCVCVYIYIYIYICINAEPDSRQTALQHVHISQGLFGAPYLHFSKGILIIGLCGGPSL